MTLPNRPVVYVRCLHDGAFGPVREDYGDTLSFKITGAHAGRFISWGSVEIISEEEFKELNEKRFTKRKHKVDGMKKGKKKFVLKKKTVVVSTATKSKPNPKVNEVLKNLTHSMQIKVAEDLGKPHDYKLEIHGVTQSLVSTFRKCERKFRLQTMGLSPMKDSQALIYGNVFHEALDIAQTQVKNGEITSWDGFNFNAIIAECELKFADDIKKATVDGKEYYELAFGWASVTLPIYFDFWRGDFFGATKKEFVEVEDEFSVEFNKTILRGKRDGVVREDGDLWLWENKTKGRWNEGVLVQVVERDLQNNTYLLSMSLEEKYAGEADLIKGVIYNIIRRPQLRRGKAEAMKTYLDRVKVDIENRPEHYFVRLQVGISQEQREVFKKQLGYQIKLIRDWYDTRFSMGPQHDIENTTECDGAYGACPFLNLCSSNLEDYTGLYIKEKLFPELERANNVK